MALAMGNSPHMRIRSLAHSVYQHQYHIVWGTKYRRHFLKPVGVQKAFRSSLYATVLEHPELYIFTFNTDVDHVHLQIEIASSISVAAAVQALKARASLDLKKQFPFIKRMYVDGPIWSVGYFSSTIGLNEKTIKRYIEYQDRRDKPRTLQARLGFS